MTKIVEKIRELIHEDRRRTIHELTDTVGISYGRKRPALWRIHNWFLHHDTSLKSIQFVTNNMVIVPHPPYSLD
jgi:hypothetical protein